MVEPSRRTSRLALAGGSLAAIGLAAGGFVLGRSTTERPAPPPVRIVSPTLAPSPAVTPTPPPTVLDRAALLAAAATAADRSAGGEPALDVASLAGRRFELSIPFGCDGPSSQDRRETGWSYDPKQEAFRVRVEPVRWTPGVWTQSSGDAKVEAVKGFWVPRPWTTSETCPPPSIAEAQSIPLTVIPHSRTVGVAEFSTSDSSRIGRRDDQVYEVVKRVPQDALITSAGFRLRLRGRVVTSPDGSPVVCRALAGADQPPTCLISMALDEVAIENGNTGATLGSWNVAKRTEPGV